MKVLKTLTLAVGLLVAGNIGSIAHAVEGPHASLFVLSHVNELVGEEMTPAQLNTLHIIAHQAAVAAVCSGFTLDEAKFTAAFGKLAPEGEAELTPEQKQYFERHLLVAYGAAFGGFLAEAATNTGGYCADAADESKDPEYKAVSVWK